MADDIEVRAGGAEDYPAMRSLFEHVYKEGHPLFVERFWQWQFGHERHGRSIIALDGDVVVGHLGTSFGGELGWLTNLYLEPEYRGRGLLRRLYGAAREFAPIVTCNVNRAGLDMYRNMGWIRYCDLVRFVAVNPDLPLDDLLEPTPADALADWPHPTGDHYWEQPGITGVTAPDGSTAVDRLIQGGLRVIDLEDPVGLLPACWGRGVRWLDFVTSWADPIVRDLDRQGWLPEDDGPVPWRLNPVVPGSRGHLAVLSELAIPADYIVRRTYCDHGRVGSLRDEDLDRGPG